MAQRLYTTPILCKGANGDWYVFFRYFDNENKKYITFKLREGLNRITDQIEKEEEFKALLESRTLELKMGWNPIIDREFKQSPALIKQHELSHIKYWTVLKALNFVVEKKQLAVKSRYDYKKSVEYFLTAANAFGIQLLPVCKLQKTHIKSCLNYLLTECGLSNKNYNKRLEHIKSLLSELVDWDALQYNPAFGIKELQEEDTEKFLPISPEERVIIKEYLFVKHYRFLIFCMVLYYTGIRPKEVLSIRISDIDLDNSFIKLNPFSNVVKTKKERRIAIHPNLHTFLRQLDLMRYNETLFLFGSGFLPGPIKTSRPTATSLWKKLIWEECGIEKYMYALKHTAADNLIEAGASEENVRDHLGHSQKSMTRRYTKLGIEVSKKAIMNTAIEF